MTIIQIPVSQTPDGDLVPTPGGPGIATVTYMTDANGVKTAMVNFAGANQAWATFDDSGFKVVSYTPFNQAYSRSIENILDYATRPH